MTDYDYGDTHYKCDCGWIVEYSDIEHLDECPEKEDKNDECK